MSEKTYKILIIPSTLVNERLDQALTKLLPAYSRTQIYTWIKKGNILVNGLSAKASFRVRGNEKVSVDIELQPLTYWEPQEIVLSIVYEDETFMIINKPVGMVVHPGAGNYQHTLLNALLYYCPSLKNLPRAGIIHRLDKDTSGLLIIAKTMDAFKHLTHQLKMRSIIREYKAIAHGIFISGGSVNAPIARHPLQRKRMAVIDTGREAITHYRVIEKYRGQTLLKLRLETGRTHQIRVHLSHLRHPIIGDITYGGKVRLSKGMLPTAIHALRQFKRQALHAFALTLIHPVTQQQCYFEIDLPQDMNDLISILKEDHLCHRV